jgi:hypothetical protein
MRVVGKVATGRVLGLDCDGPILAVCRTPGCGHSEPWRCDSYGCQGCGERKQRRLSRLVDNGADIHIGNGLQGYFLTLTAPGTRDHKRWKQGRIRGPRSECSCHLHGQTDGLWNAAESACWNRLRTSLTRERRMVFCGAVETQTRGLLHRHVLVFVEGPLDYADLQDQALSAGYGCVLDVEPVRSAQKAARYISKYVAKASGDRPGVAWERLDPDTGELTGKHPTYRLWSSSRSWGVTMKELRAVMSAQARARAGYLRELAEAIAAADGSRPAAGLGLSASTSPPPP